jgi:hypothetical protein
MKDRVGDAAGGCQNYWSGPMDHDVSMAPIVKPAIGTAGRESGAALRELTVEARRQSS